MLINSPCLYEEQLLQQHALLISTGEPGVLLEIVQDDFKRLLKNASAGRFGEPLGAIPLDHGGDDGEAITRAVQAFTARRIQQRLEATIELPPLSESVRRIMRLRSDPDVTVDEITSVVETDPALAAQVMSWASSSFYASPSKIRSVEDAIVRVLVVASLMINWALISLTHIKFRKAMGEQGVVPSFKTFWLGLGSIPWAGSTTAVTSRPNSRSR